MPEQELLQLSCAETSLRLAEMADTLHEMVTAVREIKRKDDELAALRLQLTAAQREIDAWKHMAIEYFDMLQRGIEQYGEEDVCGKALLRDADIYARFCAARGLERITASPGDPLIAELYQVIDEEQTDRIPSGAILRCTEWGYRSGSEVYKRAHVVIVK